MSEPQPEKNDPLGGQIAAFHRGQRLTAWLLACLVVALIGVAIYNWINAEARRLQLTEFANRIARIERKLNQPRPSPGGGFENGLSASQREQFYHLAEGSEVYPLDWLRVLEDKNTRKPFLEKVERFGFLADPGNPDRLPVGLTAEPARGLEPLGKMVGLNCAACHVGEFTYKGTNIRIDGAPNLLNARFFFGSLVESALATAEDPAKLLAFLYRLRDERSDQPPSKLRAGARRILGRFVENHSETLKDAVGGLLKKVLDDEKALPPLDFEKLLTQVKPDGTGYRDAMLKGYKSRDLKEPLAESRLLNFLDKEFDREGSLAHTLEEIFLAVRLLRSRAEFLKRLGPVGKDKQTDWGPGRVDAFGSARTFLFDPTYEPRFGVSYPHLWGMGQLPWFHYDGNTTSVLERNFGQALGVGAVYDKKSFASTLRPMNLHRLEMLARAITPPVWPEKVLGNIDQEKAKRGNDLFKKHCAECHPAGKKEKSSDDLIDLTRVGTDPHRANSFAAELPGGEKFVKAIDVTIGKIREKSLSELTEEERTAFEKDPKAVWRAPDKYAGRPLIATWATPPYLHNGSVPTLYDLLLPAKERPKQFPLGSREYDPVKLGYAGINGPGAFVFDTAKEGNSNAGHEFGTSLSPAERTDLLEYLKAN